MMLQSIQVIALLQGIFLLFFLFRNQSKYNPYDFRFFSALLLAMMLYIIGDDNNNLFLSDYDFFFVDKTLFITFLFLFLKFYRAPDKISLKTVGYLIPNVLFIGIELYETLYPETVRVELFEGFVLGTFLTYLCLSLFYLVRKKVSPLIKWPFNLLILSLVVALLLDMTKFWLGWQLPQAFNTILVFEIALLFYYLSYVFVFKNDFFDLPVTNHKYRNSALNNLDVTAYKHKILTAMETDRLYTHPDFSLQQLSESVGIPKHHISEILNSHLHTNFQDFVNSYRVEEFIRLYQLPENQQFSVLGIANLAGFRSKAAFHSNFKKFKGVPPTHFKAKATEMEVF